MSKNRGRPKKVATSQNLKQKIINTTIQIIKDSNSKNVTIRNVCKLSNVSIGTFYHYFKDKDDLLMYFVKDSLFLNEDINISEKNPAIRISKLYKLLIDKYISLGKIFMKSFYTTDNTALSAYMEEKNGKFIEGTIMAYSEKELENAVRNGFIEISDIHIATRDICTIVKGCVFEWCLNNENFDIYPTIERIIKKYLNL